MRTAKQQIEHQQPYIDNGYAYVVLILDEVSGIYETRHFTTRKKAERYNERSLNGYGSVMTARQLAKDFENFPL